MNLVTNAAAVDPDPSIAHAVIEADGTLSSADPVIAALNERAGGMTGRPFAVPQLAGAARLARRMGIEVRRRVTVADEHNDIDLWVVAKPEGEQVRIAATGWTATPVLRAVSAPDAADGGLYWETDRALRVTFLSIEAARTLGLNPIAILGKPLTALFDLGEGDHGTKSIIGGLDERRPYVDHPTILKPTAQAVTLSAMIRPDSAGVFAGLVGTARPITPPPVSDDVLAVAFTAGLDKALRAALTRIVADADAIETQRDGPVAAEYVDYAADIGSAGRHLMSLIDDLIDLQAIERADFKPASEQINLAEMVARAASLLSVRAENADVIIDRPPADTVMPAMGDARRVLQIMVNLIGNALRYSPAGGRIVIETAITSQTASISVIDEGKGIASEDHARIFEKFERVDPNEVGGNGLGLFIARRLARVMAGDLTVASQPGGGARFSLTLPTRQTPRHQ